MTTATATRTERLQAGDVIEVATIDGAGMTALVLIVTDDFVILDPCDESTPFTLRHDELVSYRKFDGADAFDA